MLVVRRLQTSGEITMLVVRRLQTYGKNQNSLAGDYAEGNTFAEGLYTCAAGKNRKGKVNF